MLPKIWNRHRVPTVLLKNKLHSSRFAEKQGLLPHMLSRIRGAQSKTGRHTGLVGKRSMSAILQPHGAPLYIKFRQERCKLFQNNLHSLYIRSGEKVKSGQFWDPCVVSKEEAFAPLDCKIVGSNPGRSCISQMQWT